MQKMDSETEKRVLQALERSIELSNSGLSPNEAIQKTAEDCGFSPPIVRRMVEAFNTSKTLSVFKNTPAEKRAESFPLADASQILEHMYPTDPIPDKVASVKFGVSAFEYSAERDNFTVTKQAYAELPKVEFKAYDRDPDAEYRRWSAKESRLKKEAEESRIELIKAQESMNSLVNSAAIYFRSLGHEPFESVEKRATSAYGPTGKACMDLVYAIAKVQEKRASEQPTQQYAFDRSRSPYTQIAGAIVQAKQVAHWTAKLAAINEELEKHAEGMASHRESVTLLGEVLADGKPFPVSPVKCALDFSSAAMGALGAAGFASEPDAAKYEAKALEQLRDPIHESEMSSARVKAMLNDFAVNDEVLSSYPEEQVLSAYNQLANLAPSASQQPAVMRSMLRKMVQQGGVVEPFEAQQLATLENTLRQGSLRV